MKTTKLRFERIYMCNDGEKTATMAYYGMSVDKYVFIPYNIEKGHFNGAPCSLTETEVENYISDLIIDRNSKKIYSEA